MKTLLLIFILNQGFASEILTVAHKKKLQPDGHGTIQITEKGIVYQAKKEQDSRTWAYPDIQYFDRLRKNEFIIGTYEELVPDEKLVFSWQWEGSDLVTRVTVALRALAEGHTELTLTHDGFPDAESRDKHQQGWGGCLGRLERALSEDALA